MKKPTLKKSDIKRRPRRAHLSLSLSSLSFCAVITTHNTEEEEMSFFGNDSGGDGEHHHHHHHNLHGSYGAIPGKKDEDVGFDDEADDASGVKETQRFAFFRGRKSKVVLGAIATGLAVVGCASAYYSSSSSYSSSPFLSSSSSSSSSSSPFDIVGEAAERMKKQYERSNSLERMVLESLSSSLAPLSSSAHVSKWHRWSGEKIDDDYGINILYVKTIKTGSTTTAGVFRRIASRHGINGAFTGHDEDGTTEIDDKNEPYLYADHMMFKQSEPTLGKLDHPTFLLTGVREPVSRMISEFQYVMDPSESHSKDYEVPSELLPMPVTAEEWKSRLVTFLNMQTSMNKQYDYIGSQKARDNEWSPAGIVNLYDHVVVLERFDESMVVLKNLLGLSNADLLYLRSKSNDYKWGGGSEDEMKQIVADYMQGSKDYDLVSAANVRLDEQISNIPDFDEQLRAYQDLLAGAMEHCEQYVMVGNDPTPNSDAHQCLYEDQGCGDACLSQYADSFR